MFRNRLVITLISGMAFAALPAFCNPGGSDGNSVTPASSSTVRTTVILGLDGVSKNSTGTLSIVDDALVFQKGAGPSARIPIASIQDVSLSQEDKQVGGTPMSIGRAAVPFGGGRVVGLFSHKKYDFMTFHYSDSDGGIHGVICQLNKGQGQLFGKELEARGVHVDAGKTGGVEAKNEVK